MAVICEICVFCTFWIILHISSSDHQLSPMENIEKVFRLEAEEELRVEVDCGKTDKVTVELKSGLAEIFGTEMVMNTK